MNLFGGLFGDKTKSQGVAYPNLPSPGSLGWQASQRGNMSALDAMRYQVPPKPTQRLVSDEVSATEILATRGWRLDFSPYVGVRLRSLHVDTIWEGPALVAHGDPETPDNGIHAARHEAWTTTFARYVVNASVSGVVALSGKIVEGENGYRAERAMIQSLVLHEAVGRISQERWTARTREFTRALRLPYAVAPVPAPCPVVWLEDVSVFSVLCQLEERYQCDVSLHPSLMVVS